MQNFLKLDQEKKESFVKNFSDLLDLAVRRSCESYGLRIWRLIVQMSRVAVPVLHQWCSAPCPADVSGPLGGRGWSL